VPGKGPWVADASGFNVLVDVLAGPRGGRRAIVADISDSEVVVALLPHLGLPTEAPPIARVRSLSFDFT
jgi:hypothetical protein